MSVVGVDICQESGHASWHSGAQVLGGEAVEMPAERRFKLHLMVYRQTHVIAW